MPPEQTNKNNLMNSKSLVIDTDIPPQEIIEALYDYGMSNDIERVKKFINDYPEYINTKYSRISILANAASDQNYAICALLLNQDGIDINIQTERGIRPIDSVAINDEKVPEEECEKLFKLFIDHGADYKRNSNNVDPVTYFSPETQTRLRSYIAAVEQKRSIPANMLESIELDWSSETKGHDSSAGNSRASSNDGSIVTINHEDKLTNRGKSDFESSKTANTNENANESDCLLGNNKNSSEQTNGYWTNLYKQGVETLGLSSNKVKTK